MSRRKQQKFRRGERQQPGPPWGWLLVGVLLLLAAGGLLTGRWPAGTDQPAGSRDQGAASAPATQPSSPTQQAAVDPSPGSREPETLAQATLPTTPLPGTPQSPISNLQSPTSTPESPVSNLQPPFLTPGRLSDLALTPAGARFAVAAAGGVFLYDTATLAETHHYPTPSQALAVAVIPDDGDDPAAATVATLTATGQIFRWPLVATGQVPVQGGERAPQLLANLTTGLSAAVFSPDGSLAAVLMGTARSGMEIRIYGTVKGELRYILPAHGGRAEQLLFLPAGPDPGDEVRLLTRGADGRVRLWDPGSWQELELPSALTAGVTALATGPDLDAGRLLLAAAHQDGSLSIWEAGSWQELQTVPPSDDELVGPAQALALSPDGTTVAAVSAGGALSLYEIETGEHRAGCDTMAFTRLFFLPPPSQAGATAPAPILLTLTEDGRLRSWDPGAIVCRPGQEAALAASDPDRPLLERVDFLAFGPLDTLAAAGREGRVFLWDLPAEVVTGVIDPGGPLGALAFGPDGLVATGGEVGVRMWEASTGALIHDPGGHVRTRPGAANVIALAFSPAATGETAGVLASADRSGLLKLWRTLDGALLRNIVPNEPAPVTSLAFSADGYHLLAGGGSGVTIWQPRRSERVRTVAPAGSAVAAPALPEAAPSMWQMIAVLRGPRVDLYQEDGRYLRALQAVPPGERAEPATVTAAAFLRPPEAAEAAPLLLASGHADGVIRLWDVADGRLLTTLPRHPGAVTALAAADGCTLISAAETGTIRVDQVCNQSNKE